MVISKSAQEQKDAINADIAQFRDEKKKIQAVCRAHHHVWCGAWSFMVTRLLVIPVLWRKGEVFLSYATASSHRAELQ